MTHLRSALLAMFAVATLLAGCAGGTPTTPSPTPEPVAITKPEQAVARVILAEPRLTGITAFDPNLIGQSSWYKVAPASGGGAFVVNVWIGWGDCPAGCIDQHEWVYAVGPDGTVTTVSEKGEPMPDEAWPRATAASRTGIGGTATAGPVCPVEKPGDPNCDARPVAGATIVMRDASGAEVARVQTGADGTFFADVAPGGYVVEAQPVEGLMGIPSPQGVTVNDGIASSVQLGYDTGIR